MKSGLLIVLLGIVALAGPALAGSATVVGQATASGSSAFAFAKSSASASSNGGSSFSFKGFSSGGGSVSYSGSVNGVPSSGSKICGGPCFLKN